MLIDNLFSAMAGHAEYHANQQSFLPQTAPVTQPSSLSRSPNELTLSSFAALLSSTRTNDLHQPLLSEGKPALSKFLSPLVQHDLVNHQARNFISFPALSLQSIKDSKESGMPLQDVAALNLAIPFYANFQNVGDAPLLMLENSSNSFQKLIDSRLRSSLSALVRQTLKLGNVKEARTIMRLLSKKNIIVPTTIVTSFQVLPISNGSNIRSQGRHSKEYSLPLVFEVVVDASALGKLVTVVLQAPGTITGRFNPTDNLLCHIEVAFDTITLLRSMMTQARIIVKEALSRAANIAASISLPPLTQRGEKRGPLVSLHPANSHSSSLSSIASLSNITNALSRHSSTETFGMAGNKRQRTEKPTGISAAPVFNSKTTETLYHSAEGFPSLLRDTMAMLSNDNGICGDETQSLACEAETPASDPQDLAPSSNGHDTGEHFQPFTLSSLYAKQDQEQKEAEERAKKLQILTSGPGQKKIQLFSWLKGDSMLLTEEEEQEQLMGAAATTIGPTPAPLHHKIPNSNQQTDSPIVGPGSDHEPGQATMATSIGLPDRFARGHYPNTFSDLLTADHLNGLEGLSSVASQLHQINTHQLNSGTGIGKQKSSFRNDSFGSTSSRGGGSPRMKKQVSFSLNRQNDTFPV